MAERKDVELAMITVSPRLSKDEIPYSVYHDSGLRVQEGKDTIHGNFDGTVEWYEDEQLPNVLSAKEYKEYEDKYKKNKTFVGYLKIKRNDEEINGEKVKGKESHVAVFQTYNPEDIDFSGKSLKFLIEAGKTKLVEIEEYDINDIKSNKGDSLPAYIKNFLNNGKIVKIVNKFLFK